MSEGWGVGPDPNNPYSTPPTTQELVLRGLGNALQGIGQGHSRTLTGQILRAGAGVAGGVGETYGQAMREQRLDPLSRQLLLNQAIANAAQGIAVPVSPAQTVPVEGPMVDPEMGAFSGRSGINDPRPTGVIPAITRAPRSEAEVFANARSDKDRGLLALGDIKKFVPPFHPIQYDPEKAIVDAFTGKVIVPMDPNAVSASRATNLANKIVADLAANPDDPRAKEEFRLYQGLRNDPQGADNKVFNALIAKHRGDEIAAFAEMSDLKAGRATKVTTAAEEAKVTVQVSPGARAAQANLAKGKEEGKLSVQSSQPYLDNQEAIVAAKEKAQREGARMGPEQERRNTMYEGLKSNLDVIGKTYNSGFVGGLPAAIGFQTEMDKAMAEELNAANQGKYNGGALIGRMRAFWGNLPPEQARFYRSLADAQDRVLRARSGAQINETEAARLLNIVPKATDMPAIFESKYYDFAEDVSREHRAMLEGVSMAPKELRDRLGNQPAPALRGGRTPPPKPMPSVPSAPAAVTAPKGYRIIQP